jgi:hypothetical protein
MPSILTPCRTPHVGPCDAVLSDAVVRETVESMGFRARDSHTGVEVHVPVTVFPFDGSPARDESYWTSVPAGVHALVEWLEVS